MALAPQPQDEGAKAPAQGHPRALYLLFFTEMWERFSYYGMLALLELYMRKHLVFPQERTSHIIGTYTGLVYLTPFFGGLLADKLIGYKRCLVLGGILMMAGHFLMAFDNLTAFFCALGLLILGNGAFKPNISTIVGKLYGPDDPRRDRGFTLFYMGINLGAFFSPLICGWLGENIGWHWGFAAAGVGMLFGLIVFLTGQKRLLAGIELEPQRKRASVSQEGSPRLTLVEKQRLGALVLISLFVVLFWGGFSQNFNTLNLWADVHTDRQVLGRTIPASWFQSINPLFVITLAPVLSWVWHRLSDRKREPSAPAKMVLGLLLLSLCFGLLAICAQVTHTQGIGGEAGGARSSAMWLVGAYFLMTVGELSLSPVGLSLVSKLAPQRMAAMVMGIWFLSSTVGHYLGGVLGALWTKMTPTMFFLVQGGLALAGAVAFMLLLKPLSRWTASGALRATRESAAH